MRKMMLMLCLMLIAAVFFAPAQAKTAPTGSSVTAVVFNDKDADGVRDPGEPTVKWPVYLIDVDAIKRQQSPATWETTAGQTYTVGAGIPLPESGWQLTTLSSVQITATDSNTTVAFGVHRAKNQY